MRYLNEVIANQQQDYISSYSMKSGFGVYCMAFEKGTVCFKSLYFQTKFNGASLQLITESFRGRFLATLFDL